MEQGCFFLFDCRDRPRTRGYRGQQVFSLIDGTAIQLLATFTVGMASIRFSTSLRKLLKRIYCIFEAETISESSVRSSRTNKRKGEDNSMFVVRRFDVFSASKRTRCMSLFCPSLNACPESRWISFAVRLFTVLTTLSFFRHSTCNKSSTRVNFNIIIPNYDTVESCLHEFIKVSYTNIPFRVVSHCPFSTLLPTTNAYCVRGTFYRVSLASRLNLH